MKCLGCDSEVSPYGDYCTEKCRNAHKPAPSPPTEAVPGRIWVGRQWDCGKFKSGQWRKEQAPFYAVPFVPEAELLKQVRQARAATDLLREYLRYSDSGCIEYGREDDLADRARDFVEGTGEGK